jgi:hypothetical protein
MTRPSLLIIGYYHLADGFRTCANYLEKDYTIYFFPLCHFIDNKYDIRQELISYVNGQTCRHYECGLQQGNPPIDIILFWNFRYFIENHEKFDMVVDLRNKADHPVLYLCYNWDPWPPNAEIPCLKMAFIQLMDTYLTCDGQEIRTLKETGVRTCVYCPAGFDPVVTRYIDNPAYRCDVSIVCTNLYESFDIFPRECVRVHRKELVDLLYANRNTLVLNIYGPPCFVERYPDCYMGYVAYTDCPKVFSNSKVNLCIHATSCTSDQTYIYFSERLPQILGSQGLLFCETVYDHLLIPNVNYVLANPVNTLGQIREIIHNYDAPKYRQIRQKGYDLAMQSLTWDVMRSKIKIIYDRWRKTIG